MRDPHPVLAGLLGTPYGRTDRHCWWLVALVQRELFGRDLPLSPFVERAERARFIAGHPERARWVEVPFPADGDIVLMARMPGKPIHAGVFLGDRAGVIHTDEPHGVVIDTVLELEQSRRWRLGFHRPAESHHG